MRILVVEDDAEAATAMVRGLSEAGHDVTHAVDGAFGLLEAQKGGYDVYVVDRMMPRLDGVGMVETVRKGGDQTPVLFLSALGEVEDRVTGLNAGADDYLVKPFDLAELSARIGSVARRYAGNPNPIVTHGPLEVDLAARSILRDGRPVQLTAREWVLFEAFLSRPGQMLSKAQLEDKLYAFDSGVESNAIEVHVSRLRKKLGADVIETERGLGYRLGRG